MKLLFDTNICLDYLNNRAPWADDVDRIIQSSHRICVTSLSVRDTFLYAQDENPSFSRKYMENFVSFFEVLPVTSRTIKNAFHSQIPDYEDAIQEQAAKAENVDVILTRDKHFREKSEIPVLTPQEFLDSYH